MDNLDTTGRLLRQNFNSYPNKVAMRKKRFGIWQEYTWAKVHEHVRHLGLGFKELGLKREDRVIIIGNNDPELFWAEWAVQAMRGVAICLYVDTLPEEMAFYIRDSQARFIVAEDQEQVDKFIKIQESCPFIERCIYWDPKGLWFYEQTFLLSLSELEKLGEEYEKRNPGAFEGSIDEAREEDLTLIIYSSGTTGTPKGILLNHRGMLEFGKNGIGTYPIKPRDDYVSYASPAWAEQFIGLSAGLTFPLVVSFAEEPETLQADIRDIGPKMLFYPPRLWEDLAKQIRVRLDESSWWKRWSFNWALKVGYVLLGYKEERKAVPLPWRLLHMLADILLKKVRDRFGMAKASVVFAGGSLMAPELVKFFRAIGVSLCSLYGISELGILSGAHPSDYRYETIGKPFPNVQVKIEDDELCIKTPGMAMGYINNIEGFNKKVTDGWYHTGDAALIHKDGSIEYLDRVEELIFLKDKSRFSPQFIETKLRFSPFIKDGIVIGGAERDYLVAIISIDFNTMAKWAESRGIPYTTYVELSQLPQTLELLAKEIQKVNERVPHPIKRFVSLHKEFDPDEAELTRSRKLKRSVLDERYKDIIEAMYLGKESMEMETSVTYRDGRKGSIICTLSIQSL
ncbi:MAG: AMP-binding protein [Pseudomonadota bacterium]